MLENVPILIVCVPVCVVAMFVVLAPPPVPMFMSPVPASSVKEEAPVLAPNVIDVSPEPPPILIACVTAVFVPAAPINIELAAVDRPSVSVPVPNAEPIV